MVKLTVLYNDKPVNSLVLDQNIIYIGRNSSNDLSIDHPAVAPIHGSITLEGYSYYIAQIDSDFPLILNKDKIKKNRLFNGDKIIIDNYAIIFNSAGIIPNKGSSKAAINYAESKSKKVNLPNANLQVMSGSYIGRVISLKNKKIDFGKNASGGDIAEISKEMDGYYISAKEINSDITINNAPLGDKAVLLYDTDILIIDNISMQFFLEN